MKLLITGASGQLGGTIYEISAHENYGIYFSKLPKNADKKMRKIDITKSSDVEEFVKKVKPDYVIHCAALRNVDLCEENRELAWSSNVVGTKNLVDVCRKFDVKMIFVSTDYVFDGTKGLYKENDATNPVNFYAKTKLIGEWLVQSLHDFLIARTSMLISSVPGNYVDFTINGLKNGGIDGATDIKSSPTLVSELAETLVATAENDLSGVYHLAGDTAISRYEFMKLVATVFGYGSNLVRSATSVKLKFKAPRPKDTSLDISKAKRMKMKFSTLKDSLNKIKDSMEATSPV